MKEYAYDTDTKPSNSFEVVIDENRNEVTDREEVKRVVQLAW